VGALVKTIKTPTAQAFADFKEHVAAGVLTGSAAVAQGTVAIGTQMVVEGRVEEMFEEQAHNPLAAGQGVVHVPVVEARPRAPRAQKNLPLPLEAAAVEYVRSKVTEVVERVNENRDEVYTSLKQKDQRLVEVERALDDANEQLMGIKLFLASCKTPDADRLEKIDGLLELLDDPETEEAAFVLRSKRDYLAQNIKSYEERLGRATEMEAIIEDCRDEKVELEREIKELKRKLVSGIGADFREGLATVILDLASKAADTNTLSL
jgi:hypothetical protein